MGIRTKRSLFGIGFLVLAGGILCFEQIEAPRAEPDSPEVGLATKSRKPSISGPGKNAKNGDRRILVLGKEAKHQASGQLRNLLEVESVGGPIPERVALETEKGIFWLDTPEGKLEDSAWEKAIRIKAPGHRWASLSHAKNGSILLEPINLFRIEGRQVSEKIASVRIPGAMAEFIEKDSFAQGPTMDGNWAVALDNNDFDSNHDLEFDILFLNGWVVTVEMNAALGKKVAIPFTTLGIIEEKLAKVSVEVVGPDGSLVEKGVQVHFERILPEITSSPYPWGGYIFVKPPRHSSDLSLEHSKVEMDLPLGAECLAAVRDRSRNLFGGLRFIHDGTPHAIKLKFGRRFHGRIQTRNSQSLPREILLLIHSYGGDYGWAPGDTHVKVARNGSFEFSAIPRSPYLATEDPGFSLHVKVIANKYHTEKFSVSNMGFEDVDLGTIRLEKKEPFAFVRVNGNIQPAEFSHAVFSAPSLKRSVTIRFAEKVEDGSLALYSERGTGEISVDDETIVITLPEELPEVYQRERPSLYKRIAPSKEYSVHLVFSRELGPQEVAEIGWTWKKDGPLAYLGRVDDLGSRARQLKFKFKAPPVDVFLSLRLVSKEGIEVFSRMSVPFQGGKLFVTFP
ncbi:MAG: hypothetical protein ACE5H3_02670 [Planctomycetota bacterium]